MFKLSFESATYAGLMAAIVEAASHADNGGGMVVQNITAHVAVDPDGGPVNHNAPAMDINGLPWDERIHASNKGTNADGSWRKRRGVDAATVAGVEMELRKVQAAGQTQQFQPAFNPNQQQFQPQVQQPVFNPNQQAQQFDANGQPIVAGQTFNPNGFQPQVQQQQFQPPAQQPVQQQPATVDFAGLMQLISGAMNSQAMNNNDLQTLCQNLGISNVALLQNDAPRIAAAVNLLRQWGKVA
jgi:hypothetical protein